MDELLGFFNFFDSLLYIAIFLFIGSVVLYIILSINEYQKTKEYNRMIRDKVERLTVNAVEISPEEFLEIRKMNQRGRGELLYSKNYNFSGIYILHNKSKDLYYIGQGKKVYDRVYNHFAGRGNGDVYADYKYGDKWMIRMVSLEKSGFNSLNELERTFIKNYKSYENGYNRTRGNRI
ncbi:GIY-YIG nuclease family protein [Corticicoccus populi]|uniref:GIY-YIG nuclease family protein n=1 Tax=Corticicoccus populi TaxID=1812821 RepID=A0ABW5WVP9_9STAP